jgi:hypothetical protein
MSVKISIVVKSHLNDARMEIVDNPNLANDRLKFITSLITFAKNDLNNEITDEELDNLWNETIDK